ncbi:histidine triad nucleotide-binding protein [Neisseria sp. Ec49-e6-T10]|uniref:histidine triad nucleotide-binding protein n=1 Tax=Neisseria sp. Ec49-e6-T10 TaxID=3140744 RepID=UPI003EBDAA61
MTDCIFCKIINKDIPAKIAYEDEEMLVFHDIQPKAAVHLLIIPKKHITSLAHTTAEDTLLLGKLLQKTAILAKEFGLTDGYKTQINTGIGGGQEVFHLHLHVLGTPKPK